MKVNFSVGLLFSGLTAALWITNRDKKLIKATSRELSAFLLSGISLAYITGNKSVPFINLAFCVEITVYLLILACMIL